jgi:hypothetical protein
MLGKVLQLYLHIRINFTSEDGTLDHVRFGALTMTSYPGFLTGNS